MEFYDIITLIMRIGNKKESLVLLAGDILAFALSLWLSLLVRNFGIPELGVYLEHILPFAIVSAVWVILFFIAGLYEKQRISNRKRLPELLFKTQILNSIIAVLFFYSVPDFGLAPKTILFLYIIISLALSFIWRVYAVSVLNVKIKSKAILIADGQDAKVLVEEMNNNNQFSYNIVETVNNHTIVSDGVEQIIERIKRDKIKVVIVDSRDERVATILPELYKLIFSNITFVDFYELYEDVFDRLPISLIGYAWFLENISTAKREGYEFLKRMMDLVLAVPAFAVSLPFYIVAYAGIKLQDNGPTFIVQERVGKNNKPIKILKFRSMRVVSDLDVKNDSGLRVTPFGAFLRASRIDELPQLLNVIKGDLSVVGPRPELPALVSEYEKELPYYNVRHIIKPGLFGWAQLYHENHPHHGVDVLETKNKLSYDLYYIKHRTFPLDVIIALKTIKVLMSRQGR
jgi:exopolysaccharide biosynthesis polyprenyl glycosylphosphotransferase